MKTLTRLAIAAGLFALAAILILKPDAPDAPKRGTILTASARVAGNASAAEAGYLEAITRQPSSTDGYVDLAQFYLIQARVTADEGYYVPRAEAQLERALELDANDYRARVLMGTLQNKLHQFEQSADLARALIAESPGHAYNYGTLVDALVELGHYDDAIATMDKMLALRPDLSSYSRASYIRELMGDSEGAIRAMEMAVQAGAIGSEGRSWSLYQLAMLAVGEGDFSSAERLLNGLIEETPGYPHAVAGLAHLRLVQGNLAEARTLVEQAMNLAPGAGFEELALEVYEMDGDAEAAALALEAIEQSLQDADAMGENVRMELADFYADTDQKLDEALWLSSLEISRRPDHLHANETYAWVLHKLGRPEQAVAYINHANRFDNGDAKLSFRAGVIHLAAGNQAMGTQLIEQALEQGLAIESPTAAAEARILLTSSQA